MDREKIIASIIFVMSLLLAAYIAFGIMNAPRPDYPGRVACEERAFSDDCAPTNKTALRREDFASSQEFKRDYTEVHQGDVNRVTSMRARYNYVKNGGYAPPEEMRILRNWEEEKIRKDNEEEKKRREDEQKSFLKAWRENPVPPPSHKK